MMAMPMMSMCGPNCWNGFVKPAHLLGTSWLQAGKPKLSPCLTRSTKSGGFLAPLSCPRSDTNGDEDPFGKAICQGWRIPVANTLKALPFVFIDRMSYTYGDVFEGP